MGITETGPLVHNYVNLDIQLIACVVGLDILDLLDHTGEAHRHVQQNAVVGGGGGCTCEAPDILTCRLAPIPHDVDGEEETTQGIKEPETGERTD